MFDEGGRMGLLGGEGTGEHMQGIPPFTGGERERERGEEMDEGEVRYGRQAVCKTEEYKNTYRWIVIVL